MSPEEEEARTILPTGSYAPDLPDIEDPETLELLKLVAGFLFDETSALTHLSSEEVGYVMISTMRKIRKLMKMAAVSPYLSPQEKAHVINKLDMLSNNVRALLMAQLNRGEKGRMLRFLRGLPVPEERGGKSPVEKLRGMF